MPIESKIVPAERLVLTKSWGVVTFEEVIANQDLLLADPEFNPDYDELGIHMEAESFIGTTQQAATVARRKTFSKSSILAHVAYRDHLYGLLRMMATYYGLEHENKSFQIFRDEDSARQWLSQMRAQRQSNTL